MAQSPVEFLSAQRTYIVLLAFLIGTFGYVYRAFRKPTSHLPGPWYTKWTSLVLKYHWLTGRRAYYVHELHQKYGPVVRLAPDEVDVSDVASVREIHSLKGGYNKSPWYYNFTASRLPSTFNTCDIEFHRRHRRLLAGPMSEASLKSAMPLVSERAHLAIERMREEMKRRGAVDVAKWCLFFPTDVIGELSFGESFRMLEIGKKNEYIEFLESIAVLGSIRTTFPSLCKISATLPLPLFKRVAQQSAYSRRYAVESIQRYKRQLSANPTMDKPMLFKKLFQAGEEGLSDDEIVSEAQSYIVAGSDTTANSLTYLLWAVCKQPKIRDTLVKEVQGLNESDIDGTKLAELPYLNCVVEETLRLYSAAPSGLPRIVPAGGVTLADHFLPGGITVTTQAFTLHRNPDVFSHPELFDPERWNAPTKEMKHSFMPFGGGSRICLGLHLAKMEIRYAATLFFRAFPNARVSELEGMSDKDMYPKIYFLLFPQGKRCLIQAE